MIVAAFDDLPQHWRRDRLGFCADEYVETPAPGDQAAAVRCPHEVWPVRYVRLVRAVTE